MQKFTYPEYKKKLDKAHLRLRKAYKEVKDSYAEMIFKFALLAEHKDEATGSHLVRISDYCAEIAKSLNLPKTEIEYIRYASPMHDIGKLIIPDAIIKKKSGLTPDEREIIKTHTTLGADVFKDSRSPLLNAARIMILTHHEKYDGTGYPIGLKGKQIPLYGRIVSLADFFDAITSDRPYRKGYKFDTAIDMIKEQSGRHFDPDIVKVFLSKKDKIKKIWKANHDIESFILSKQE